MKDCKTNFINDIMEREGGHGVGSHALRHYAERQWRKELLGRIRNAPHHHEWADNVQKLLEELI